MFPLSYLIDAAYASRQPQSQFLEALETSRKLHNLTSQLFPDNDWELYGLTPASRVYQLRRELAGKDAALATIGNGVRELRAKNIELERRVKLRDAIVEVDRSTIRQLQEERDELQKKVERLEADIAVNVRSALRAASRQIELENEIQRLKKAAEAGGKTESSHPEDWTVSWKEPAPEHPWHWRSVHQVIPHAVWSKWPFLPEPGYAYVYNEESARLLGEKLYTDECCRSSRPLGWTKIRPDKTGPAREPYYTNTFIYRRKVS